MDVVDGITDRRHKMTDEDQRRVITEADTKYGRAIAQADIGWQTPMAVLNFARLRERNRERADIP